MLLLWVLYALHWAVTLFGTTYVFFRRSSRYDYIFFALVTIVIINWSLSKNQECILSYWEKLLLDPRYEYGSDTTYHPSMHFTKNVYLQNAVHAVVVGMMVYNSVRMLLIYNVKLNTIILLVVLASIYFLYFRIIHAISEFQKLYLLQNSPPQWLTEDPYIKGIYEKKTHEPIGIVNVYNILACALLSRCEKKQLTWKDFENDVQDMAKRLPECDYYVGIQSGGVFVAKYLQLLTGTPALYVKASKYNQKYLLTRSIELKEVSDLSVIRNKRVILCDDQSITGDTLRVVKERLQMYNPSWVKTCVLYTRHKVNNVDFYGSNFTIAASPWGSTP